MMQTKKLAIVVVALVASASTSYSDQGKTDMMAAVHVAAEQQVEGRRADIDQGQAAPFDGVLLDDEALGAVRDEVDSLRQENVSLRAALEAQKQATETAESRADLWEKQTRPSAVKWVAQHACSASIGAIMAVIALR